ncbi:MAG: AAA family ATPase, partial [Ignavibacteria bacterium]
GHSGLQTYPLKIKKPKLVLNKNYNDDLSLIHEKIIHSLKQKDKGGLILFHGMPGTGKSTYIRYLIRSINKKVIFMPPGLAGNLDAPNLASFLIKSANTVFVIEDAEELLASRDAHKNSSISMLLNLTDGLLGETLGIQVIATFNTDLQNVDKALLRKGRLLALYEFKPLAIEKSRVLLQESGIKDYFVSEPMTLADIYNFKVDGYQINKNNRTQIGFLSTAV